MKKTIFIISGLVLATGLGIWAYRKFGQTELGSNAVYDKKNNWEKLQFNLGQNGAPDSSGKISLPFNGGKNFVTFYNNGRFFIFDVNKKQIGSGNYTDGGRTLIMDNKEPVSSASVYSNLKNII